MSVQSSAAPYFALDILLMVSLSHFLNDTVQSIIPAALPLLKDNYALTFTQVGLITLTVQLTSSIFQPIVGIVTDRRPFAYALPLGMLSTLAGIVLLSQAHSFAAILFAVGLAGFGSAIFHPEGAKVIHSVSANRKGFAQALFQVGGNAGFACGPLAAAWLILSSGQDSIIWFAVLALIAVLLLWYVSSVMKARTAAGLIAAKNRASGAAGTDSLRQYRWIFVILFVLMVSKQVYIASLGNYLTFFTMHKFGIDVTAAQYVLFSFLAASAIGTLLGGPIGDKIGRRMVILWSILGAAPFALLLPWTPLWAVVVLSIVVGFVMSSAFSAILVYAIELSPANTGTISGLFFGFSFGLGGVASAVFGVLADQIGIESVFVFASVLPLLGAVAFLLPKNR